MSRLAEGAGASLWIDRRIDTERELTLTSRDASLASLLDAAAAELGLGAAAIDRVVYVGPKHAAAALPELSAEWRRSAPRSLMKRRALEWPRLTTPRQLAESVASEAGVKIVNPEVIPHDLWPAGSTPPLAAGDRLTLVCVGFDLRWRLGGSDRRSVRIEPIEFGGYAKEPAPLAELATDETAPPGETRYTLRVVEQPLGAVLKQLAGQLGLELRIDTASFDPLRRVTFEVTNGSLVELLQALGEAAGLSVQASAETLTVSTRD